MEAKTMVASQMVPYIVHYFWPDPCGDLLVTQGGIIYLSSKVRGGVVYHQYTTAKGCS
jgi:hypothetical protein